MLRAHVVGGLIKQVAHTGRLGVTTLHRLMDECAAGTLEARLASLSEVHVAATEYALRK